MKGKKKKKQNEESESLFFSVLLFASALMLSCLGIGIIYFSLAGEIPALYKSVLSRGWTKTEGKIIKTYNTTKTISIGSGSAKNSRSATVFVPTVEYSFQAGDEIFIGSRINFSGEEKYFFWAEESRDYLNASFPVNKNVEVFYNPNNPQESTLSREYVYNSDNYQAGCCCGIVELFFGLITWLSFRDLMKHLRRRKKREQ